jgi:hypothetical protein
VLRPSLKALQPREAFSVTGTLRFPWLEAQSSRTRLALALAADGVLAVLAIEASYWAFPAAAPLTNLWLAAALTGGGLWVLLSVGLYRDRQAYFGEGSRRRRLLGGVLVLLYSALVNEVAGAPLSLAFVLAFGAGFYLAALGSRSLARRLLT